MERIIDMTDETLKSMVERVFVSKPCDKESPIVIAAIITAAMEMSIFSSAVKEIDVLNELLEVYGISDSYEDLNLIGMDDDLIEQAIGYRVDTANPQEYLSYKDMYNTMYLAIKVRKIDKKENSKTINMK